MRVTRSDCPHHSTKRSSYFFAVGLAGFALPVFPVALPEAGFIFPLDGVVDDFPERVSVVFLTVFETGLFAAC